MFGPYSDEEKRKDDAEQAWLEYLNEHWADFAYNHNALWARPAFIAGYLEGRKDGKIGV